MKRDINKVLNNLLSDSQLIKAVKSVNKNGKENSLFPEVRSLSAEEIDVLTTAGNRATDWSLIKVVPEFRTDFIKGNIFNCECTLGLFDGSGVEIEPGVLLQNGIYNSTLSNSKIAKGCLIKDCSLITDYIIKENAILIRNGFITAEKKCTFGNGIRIPVGMETGGREVISCAEINIKIAELIALSKSDEIIQQAYADFCNTYEDAVRSDYGIIECDSRILNTNRIRNTYIGEGAVIDGAAMIDNCTVLSSNNEKTEISNGALVKNSCVQWGCVITSMSIVNDSIMTEHSHAERHGKITASIIGPNSGVAEGEATSCLIGQFTGFHHQSMLIAALWPEGKGNIGYGANVGSNHTSRLPDQEIFCGEGMFFGLSASIKFPSDFSRAPYSIIATGVVTLPQKIEFPFSLIQSSSANSSTIPLSYNEIIPAWVLSDNIYMLKRNEEKFKNRNKARRTEFDFNVFRPEIIDLMIEARNRLSSVKRKKKIYTDKDIQGLGKNYLIEDKRIQAINTYTFYIEYYCLHGLKEYIADLAFSGNKKNISSIYTIKTENEVWEHQRLLIKDDGYNKTSPENNLKRLKSIIQKISEDVYKSKEKDDFRGMKIIPDYTDAATKAADDSFVMSERKKVQEETDNIEKLILYIKN